jgi:hypothetical protein
MNRAPERESVKKQGNALFQSQPFTSYIQKVRKTDKNMLLGLKGMRQMRMHDVGNKGKSSKAKSSIGEPKHFKGLQNFILSGLDSGSDEEKKKKGETIFKGLSGDSDSS